MPPPKRSTSAWDLAKHGLKVGFGTDVERAVLKATNFDEVTPKEKHVRYLLGVLQLERVHGPVTPAKCVLDLLLKRLHEKSWVVVLKTLIVYHRLIREGSQTFVLHLYGATAQTFSLRTFSDRTTPETATFSSIVRSYAIYLEEKLCTWRTYQKVLEPSLSGSHPLKHMKPKELMETLQDIQNLINALQGVEFPGKALENPVPRAAFELLLHDNLKLYVLCNEGVLALLECFFKMDEKQARQGVKVYHTFVQQAEAFRKAGEDVPSNLSKIVAQGPSKSMMDLVPTLGKYVESLSRGEERPDLSGLIRKQKAAQGSGMGPPEDSESEDEQKKKEEDEDEDEEDEEEEEEEEEEVKPTPKVPSRSSTAPTIPVAPFSVAKTKPKPPQAEIDLLGDLTPTPAVATPPVTGGGTLTQSPTDFFASVGSSALPTHQPGGAFAAPTPAFAPTLGTGFSPQPPQPVQTLSQAGPYPMAGGGSAFQQPMMHAIPPASQGGWNSPVAPGFPAMGFNSVPPGQQYAVVHHGSPLPVPLAPTSNFNTLEGTQPPPSLHCALSDADMRSLLSSNRTTSASAEKTTSKPAAQADFGVLEETMRTKVTGGKP